MQTKNVGAFAWPAYNTTQCKANI